MAKNKKQQRGLLSFSDRMFILVIFFLVGIWYHFDMFGFQTKTTLWLMFIIALLYFIAYIESVIRLFKNEKTRKKTKER